tara:strand:- start:89 stop:574 length:486 start_codon:yes stop_codon:yes gene_type:complete
MKEFKSKPIKGLTDLNDSKYSIRAEQARINGKSKASIEAARKLGKKYGKLNMEKYMTADDKLRGAKQVGKKNVESGHLQGVSHLGGKKTSVIQKEERNNNVSNILSKLNDTFVASEVKKVCLELGLSSSYHKSIVGDTKICEMIYKSPKPNQYNPSIYKKL